MAATRLFELIQEEMRRRNLSQNEFARLVGVSPATLSAIRHGHTPTVEVLRLLADKLGMQLHDLAEIAGVMERDPLAAEDIRPEVRELLRRFDRLPPDRQKAIMRMFEDLVSFAEAQTPAAPQAEPSAGSVRR